MSLIILNGTIVTSEHTYVSDIQLDYGKIIRIGNDIKVSEADEVIHAEGKYIFPGGIDAHVHLDLPTPAGPSSDNFISGTLAGLFGGTTTIIDFITPLKTESSITALEKRMKDAENAAIDYSFHMGITSWNENTAAEMDRCVREFGITSFKTYMAYQGVIGIKEEELLLVMKTAARLHALVTVHCELGDDILLSQKEFIDHGKTEPIYHALSRPPETESESVKHVIALAKNASCPVYIVHTSVKESLEHIEKAQSEGQQVYSETCPQYLILDESVYHFAGYESMSYIISPPLRNAIHQKYLWEGLKKETIQVVATDHCPFLLKGQKDYGVHDFTKIPNGAGGIEHRLSLLYTYGVLYNNLTLNNFVAVTSTNPAKIFGLYPEKGEIAPGSDADLVIWNPETDGVISSKTHHQHCDTNIYEGISTKGSPDYVILKGEVVVERGKMKQGKLIGRYLKR